MKKTEKICWQDAWVLQAIYYSEKHTLNDIIFFCDYINHAIMTYQEFNIALKKLLSIGYVKFSDDEIVVTPNFLKDYEIYKKNQKWEIHLEMKKIQDFLRERKIPENLDGIEDFNKKRFNEAVEDYINQSKKNSTI